MLNFIERHFGISPDGGDGSVEAVLIVFLFMALSVIAMRLPGYRR
jgi:hypothetical protein